MKTGLLCKLVSIAALHATGAIACQQHVVQIETPAGSQTFSAEIADDSDERAKGLSGRAALDRNAGMLFLYDKPHKARFWMLGMKISLDMMFIEPDGRIAAVQHNVQPGKLWPVSGGDGIIAVFEINAGEAEQRGIGTGAYVRHPAFGCSG